MNLQTDTLSKAHRTARHRDYKRVRSLPIPSGNPVTSQTQTRLLRVVTDHYVAGSVWQRNGAEWHCTQTAPILHWMKGMSPHAAKLALLRANAQFTWHPANQAVPAVRVPSTITVVNPCVPTTQQCGSQDDQGPYPRLSGPKPAPVEQELTVSAPTSAGNSD